MARYIDANKFIDWLDVGHLRSPIEVCFSELDVKSMIELQPTADVREIVYAHWDSSSESYRCTNCGRALDEIMDGESYFSGRINIEKEVICCPFCGAYIREEKQ